MTKLNQRKAGRRVPKLESLEDRRMMTQSPLFLGPVSVCTGDPIVGNFLGEAAAYFSGAAGYCGSRLDFEGLWRTDGTVEGTVAIGASLHQRVHLDSLHEVHGKLYFNVGSLSGSGVEIFDSTTAPNSASQFSQENSFIVGHLNDQLLYGCYDTCGQLEFSQFRVFDGQSDLVLAESPGEPGTAVHAGDRVKLGDTYFFGGDQLWRMSESLEIQSFQKPIKELPEFYKVNIIGKTNENEIYFLMGFDLWVSDGTTVGTRPIDGGFQRPQALIWNDDLIVESGNSLFLVDGDQVTKLYDLSDGDGLIGSFGWSQYDWNARRVFVTGNEEMIVTDGTPEGTSRVFRSGNEDFSSTLRLHHTDKYLLFEWEVIRFTANGIEKVRSIRRSDGSTSRFVARGQLAATSRSAAYYFAEDEYWILSDHETEPIRFAERLGVNATDIHLSLDDGSILFSALDDDGENRFWLTDGTQNGTRVLGGSPPNSMDGFDFSYLDRFFQFRDKIIFEAEYGVDDGGGRLFSLTIPPTTGSLADLDRDGTVAFADFLILSQNFGKTEASREDGDIDQNGIVEYADFLLLSENFGKRLS